MYDEEDLRVLFAKVENAISSYTKVYDENRDGLENWESRLFVL